MTDQCGSGTGAERQVVTLARTAIAQGLDALAANDLKVARRWLERAHRLVPHDANATLLLATTCLRHDPVFAATLFQSVTDKHDIRQAWVGLAAARLRTDGPEAAEQPLAAALSRHAFSPDITGLANAVGLRPDKPGWCALRSDGQLLIQARMPSEVRVLVDDTAISGTQLPAGWEGRRTINVWFGDVSPLGIPIDIRAIRRVAGCVEEYDGGIRGWAWYPADPETSPVLTIRQPARNQRKAFVARDESIIVPDAGPLARPRSFSLTYADLLDVAGPIHIQGLDGMDLPGSPLNPFGHDASHVPACQPGHDDPAPLPRHTAVDCVQEQCVDTPPPSKQLPTNNERKPDVAVVIRVHDGGDIVLACLAGVLASTPTDTLVVVVDDGSSQPAIIAALDDWARQRRITLLRHSRMLGCPASANAGILAAERRDVVLLSSNVLVPPDWIERLGAAAYASHDIGTVTPLSNTAGLLNYPAGAVSVPPPDQNATNRLDRLVQWANGSETIDIPTGAGFCLYLRRDCLNAAGMFRPDLFAQGPGGDEEFCLRAHRLGWRSVALTGLFVGHVGGLSHHGPTHLRARNSRIVEQRHPGHDAAIDSFLTSDPLAGARRRIDRLIWRKRARKWRQVAILITHHDGGGVEQRLIQAVARHAALDRKAIILRPTETAHGEPAIAVHDELSNDFPNLVYIMPRELPALVALLRTARPEMIEAHQLAGYPPIIYDLITRLKLPYTVHVHDYAWFCPRISLLGGKGRYCEEPDTSHCEICVTNNGHFLTEDITVSALRERSAGFLQAAQLVVVPSDDTGIRMRRYFNGLRPATIPHQDDALIARHVGLSLRGGSQTSGTRSSVCVPGAIGVHKGYDVLLACARDAAQRDLDLEFIIVGHTIDDARMLATGRVFITGQFEAHEAVTLIAEQQAHLGFIPSICPETWCLSLGDIWRAGLAVAAFDIGAQAERIRRYGQGLLLPLGLSASAINDTLVAAIGAARGRRAGTVKKVREVEHNSDYPSRKGACHVACPNLSDWAS